MHEAGALVGVVQARGCLRGAGLLASVRRAGLEAPRFFTTPVERTAPLNGPARRFWGGILGFFAGVAGVAGETPLPAADSAFWATLREEGGVARLLDDPDLVLTEGNVLVVNTVPAAGRGGAWRARARSEMMGDGADGRYDAIIIGARVAGASLALLLGRRGRRVLLVDRDRFPSDTLSTHFMGVRAVPLLARLGVLEAVEAVGFRRIARARTWVEDCLFEGPIGPPGAYALAPRRDVLDALLIERAVATGNVTFRERTRATGLVADGGRVAGARLARADGGDEREVRARVVVGADGKDSRVAAWVRAARYHAAPIIRPAYYAHLRGLEPLPEPALELYFGGGRTALLFPMRPGEDCLALAARPDEFATFRTDPRGRFEAIARALPGMAARLRGATVEDKVLGTRGVENHFRQPYGPGWALTGDAAYLKDPATGSGIGDALNQAFWLADALDATLGGADWETTLADYRRRRDEAFLPGYRATLAIAGQPDAPPEALAWTRATLAAPSMVLHLATGIGAALPAALPSAAYATLAQLARGFGVPPGPQVPAAAD